MGADLTPRRRIRRQKWFPRPPRHPLARRPCTPKVRRPGAWMGSSVQLYAEPPRLPKPGVSDARRQNHVTGLTHVTQDESRLNRFIIGVSPCILQVNHTHVIHFTTCGNAVIPGKGACAPTPLDNLGSAPGGSQKKSTTSARMPQPTPRATNPTCAATRKSPIRRDGALTEMASAVSGVGCDLAAAHAGRRAPTRHPPAPLRC